ncbi:MAG: hypothetical protein SF123_24860 [Chloroflexota bacterium]|nr:hypothetical protein [Chloroflexota bacterium]
MTRYDAFYVDKGQYPFGDLLTVFGLARVLSNALSDASTQGYRLDILDKGSYYQLVSKSPIERDGLSAPRMPQRAIRTPKTLLPDEIASYDYEAEKAVVSDFFAAKRHNADAASPSPYWDILRAINPAALPGYNSLMVDWYTVSGEPEVFSVLLDLFASTPNDVGNAVKRWQALDKANGWGIKAYSTAQQLYNPDSGKGQNRVKADGMAIGNVDQFWLIEWLKAVGFYEGALTRLMRGTKDRKTFVLAPRDLTWETHSQVMAEFVGAMQVSESSTRFDCLAVLRYSRALLDHLVAPGGSPLDHLRRKLNVRKHVASGFYTAFYKDMGNAIATMNMSFIALPGWISVENRDEATLFIEILNELEQFVRQFDESHSDAFALLQYLRDFLSGDDIRALFRFTNAFPAYLMGKRERNQYARQLSTEFIERLIMSSEKPLARILESSGFQNIAYAIRQSTVTAQRKKQEGNRRYDIRYGLGQELVRRSRYRNEFVVALTDFIHKYNAENAMVLEKYRKPNTKLSEEEAKNFRRSILTRDIDEIVVLIDEYDSQTVANLLIAYGYARVSTEQQDDQEPTELNENEENAS